MKHKKIHIAFITLFVLISVTYAVTKIWSNIVTVNVSAYNLTLSVEPSDVVQYENVTFTGTFTLDGVAVETANITLYEYNGLAWKPVAYTFTNSMGMYAFEWNMTQIGSFDYKTGFES